MEDWTVYIIETRSGKLYTGITKDLNKRFKAHEEKKGARFFRISEPLKVLYCEKHVNRSEASKREHQIKQLSRKEKLILISSYRA